LSTQRVMCYIL